MDSVFGIKEWVATRIRVPVISNFNNRSNQVESHRVPEFVIPASDWLSTHSINASSADCDGGTADSRDCSVRCAQEGVFRGLTVQTDNQTSISAPVTPTGHRVFHLATRATRSLSAVDRIAMETSAVIKPMAARSLRQVTIKTDIESSTFNEAPTYRKESSAPHDSSPSPKQLHVPNRQQYVDAAPRHLHPSDAEGGTENMTERRGNVIPSRRSSSRRRKPPNMILTSIGLIPDIQNTDGAQNGADNVFSKPEIGKRYSNKDSDNESNSQQLSPDGHKHKRVGSNSSVFNYSTNLAGSTVDTCSHKRSDSNSSQCYINTDNGEVKFSFQYLPVTKQLKIMLLRAFDLPSLKRAGPDLNSYCKIYLSSGKTFKWVSRVVYRTKNPTYDQECFFKCDGLEELTTMTLVVKVLAKTHTFKGHKHIGETTLCLNGYDLLVKNVVRNHLEPPHTDDDVRIFNAFSLYLIYI